MAASNPSRLALRAGGDETHTESRRRLRRRKLEQHYWDSTCLSDWFKAAEAALTDDLAYGASYNVICMPAVGLQHVAPKLHCNLSVPDARVAGSFSRPPKAERTAAVLMPLWACAEKGFKADRPRPKRLAGVRAGFRYATKTLPRTPHVMERVFRRGPEEHQGAIASSFGAC
ncbi:hypothetical protein PSPO01_08841 [Paraphaeosphaeria sporulosa]